MSGKVEKVEVKKDCPKPEGLNDIQDKSFLIVGEELVIECLCEQSESYCLRKPTLQEIAKAKALKIIKE
jgi:hypothetical protein